MTNTHQQGIELFQKGEFGPAGRRLGEALGEQESSELWNDWATAKLAGDEPEEAEVGYRRALELDPQNHEAATNLVVLLSRQGRSLEAIPLLELASHGLPEEERATLAAQASECREQAPDNPQALREFLQRFGGDDPNEQSYFSTHLERYLATLDLIPYSTPGQRLLELGAAYHHLTPALARWKGYRDIHCSDIWEGEPERWRRITSRDGQEQFWFPVRNFDVEQAPWPYGDEEFDVVLLCEMLEHLVADPMQVLSEINRLLKPEGTILLTTPNLASAKSLDAVLRGESPYIYGQFEPGGRPTDRHNREYTPEETARLLAAAGFLPLRNETRDFYWGSARPALRYLAATGHSLVRRGDTMLVLARKEAAVRERYPAEFYSLQGTQTARRDQQEESRGAGKVDRESSEKPPLHILMVHEILPEYDRTGCDQRLMQVLRELRAQGHEVTYLARNGANRERYLPALKDLGIRVYAHDAERVGYLGLDAPADWKLEEVLARGCFDLAILYHWYWTGISVPEHYLDAIRRLSPPTRIAVLTDDRHGHREMRLAEISGRWSDWERAQNFKERELEVYRAADLVLTVSEEDRQGLLAEAPELLTDVLPNDAESLAGEAADSASPGFAERDGFLFLGNFDNPANRDAIDWFLEQVWPRLRKQLPQAHLFLVGNRLPVDFAARVPGVVALGYVEDLAELFRRHRVFVSPVRYGTGTKTKNLNALAHGLPVVTTPIGAEGLNLHHETDALIAETPAAFAEAALRLFSDEQLWQKLSIQGPEHIRQEFSHQRLCQSVARITERVHGLKPQVFNPNHQWSFLRVEARFPEVLQRQPAWERAELRLFGYIRLAEALAAGGEPVEARRQLRHVFSFLRGNLPQTPFARHLFDCMEKCYRQLGDEDAARRFQQEVEAGRQPESQPRNSGLTARAARKSRRSRRQEHPQLTVIVPTFNRAATLNSCLEALNRQTLAPDRFEVIVVDDGSTDQTAELCRSFASRFRLRHLRQPNAGAGAARRAGVEQAAGEYLLFLNDDTMACPRLLEEHWLVQNAHRGEKLAVLGDFRYPPAARQRALTYFLNSQPFLFPQMNLHAGTHDKNSCFIACNLSLPREAVLAAGSFDRRFRVAEDTELGVRLRQIGYRVLYHPSAWAWHDHLSMTLGDLLHRARAYGEAEWMLLRKHPQLLGDGTGPFGQLSDEDAARLAGQVDHEREEVAEAVRVLQKFDHLDFLPLFSQTAGERTRAEEVMDLFSQIVPKVFYHHLFSTFLEAWSAAAESHRVATPSSSQAHGEARA